MHSVVHSFAFVVLLITITPGSAVAQAPGSNRAASVSLGSDSLAAMERDAWTIETLDDQLTSLLESGDPEKQNTAMTIIINFRRQRPEAYDFVDCISPLMQIYRSDQQEGMRLLALAALDAIGTPRAYETLRRSAQTVRSRRVRRQTALVLHYADKRNEPAS